MLGLSACLFLPPGPAFALTDAAAGRTVTLSSTYSTYVGANLVDGSDSTIAVTTTSQPAWAVVDLGSATSIGSYSFAGREPAGGNTALQYSTDGTTFSDAVSVLSGASGTGSFGPFTARYWRLLATAGSGSYVQFATLNLWVYVAPTTTTTAPATTTTVAPTTTTVPPTTTTTAPVTTTTVVATVIVQDFSTMESELVLGLALLVFLSAAGMVGSWRRR